MFPFNITSFFEDPQNNTNHQQQEPHRMHNSTYIPQQFRGTTRHATTTTHHAPPPRQQNPFFSPFSQHHTFHQHQNHFHRPHQHPAPRTSRKALDTLPVFEYTLAREYCMKNREGRIEQDACCSICIEEYRVQDKLIQLPCQHIFHYSCSRPWLDTKNTCPSCRFELPVEDPVHERERVARMRELFTADGLRIMEIGSQVEQIFEKVLNVREVVEPGHCLDDDIIKHFAEMLDSCDGYLMKATLELDAMDNVKTDRVRQQRRSQIKNIQFMQSMIDEIRLVMGENK